MAVTSEPSEIPRSRTASTVMEATQPDAAGVEHDVGDGLTLGDARDAGGDLVSGAQFHAGKTTVVRSAGPSCHAGAW